MVTGRVPRALGLFGMVAAFVVGVVGTHGCIDDRKKVAAQVFFCNPASRTADEVTSRGLQALVDRYRKDAGGRTVVGTLPVHVSFPTFGPSVFLASELTAESGVPALDLVVRRTNSHESAGGGR